VDVQWTDAHPPRGEAAYYVRVTQSGFAFAWSSPIWVTCTPPDAAGPELAGAPALPAWNEGSWPPPAGGGSRAEAATYLAALERFLASQGAGGRYVDLDPIGMFREHRGRYALFRGHDAGGAVFSTSSSRDPAGRAAQNEPAATRSPVHVLYYPDFPEPRVRVGIGWADFGIGRSSTLRRAASESGG
jgi:hypothetical protein